MKIHEIHTPRLLLRNWKDSDILPFSSIGQDELVMKYFPKLMSREESRIFVQKMQERMAEYGYWLWAAEELASSEFIGFIGIKPILNEFPATSTQSPPVEID